jgi:hypothetical protein
MVSVLNFREFLFLMRLKVRGMPGVSAAAWLREVSGIFLISPRRDWTTWPQNGFPPDDKNHSRKQTEKVRKQRQS